MSKYTMRNLFLGFFPSSFLCFCIKTLLKVTKVSWSSKQLNRNQCHQFSTCSIPDIKSSITAGNMFYIFTIMCHFNCMNCCDVLFVNTGNQNCTISKDPTKIARERTLASVKNITNIFWMNIIIKTQIMSSAKPFRNWNQNSL